jgi:RNA polymerase sigma factor (sigma-70 family)
MAHRSLHPLLHYLRRLGGNAGAGPLEDAQLLGRFLTSRDESAFTMIVQRYGAMVSGLCVRRLGETPEAEDAFQATFLVLVRKAASLRSPQPLGPWLYGVANRTALKLRGKRTRRSTRETVLPEQVVEQQPEQAWADLRLILDDEINRLPTKYRLPVLLCYLQGLSSEEAARQLGCAKGTIFSRLSRARDLLRRRLIRRGLEMSAGALAAGLAETAGLRAAPSLALRDMTMRTSLLLAAGTTGQSLSVPLAALVEGVVRSMFFSKVKFAVIIVLAFGLAGAGAGFLGHRSDAEQPTTQQHSKSAPAQPTGVALKTKEKIEESKPYVPPPAVVGEKQRLREWRDRLVDPINYLGLDDPQATLGEALDQLAKAYNVTFVVNERAFRAENLINPLETDKDIRRSKIASISIPPFRGRLRTVLQTILDHVETTSPHLTIMFLVRKDHIEITTSTFVRMELGFRNERPIPPLVWDSFEETDLAWILPRLAETSGYNIMADPKAGEKLHTRITMQLNNVPVDTAVRLMANMAGLSVVRLDNVFYVTTAENAKQLREEQAKINADTPAAAAQLPTTVPEKRGK